MKKKYLFAFIFLNLIFIVLTFSLQNICNAESFNILKGNLLYKNGYYSEAFNKYKSEIIRHPDNKKAIFNAANSLYKLEDYTTAIDYYKKALLKSKSKNIQSKIHYNMGNSFYKLGEYNEALNEYIKALSLDPYNRAIKQNIELTAEKLKNMKNNKGSRTKTPQPGRTGKNSKKNQNQQSNQSKNETPTKNTNPRKTNKALTEEEAKKILNSLEEKNQDQLKNIIMNRLNKELNNEKGW